MKVKAKIKIVVDILMTVALLLLMAYSQIGDDLHEYIGTAMFVLFIVHHCMNASWSKNMFRGKYTIYRTLQTVVAVIIFVCMVGLMVSGVMMSRYVFYALPIKGGMAQARTIHMLASNWGFVFMGIHLGLNWNMILSMVRKHICLNSVATNVIDYIPNLIAVYGIFAMFRRQIPDYLFLRTHFAMFNYGEPVILFLLDYLAVMVLFVWIGHFLGKLVKLKINFKERKSKL